MTNVESPVTTNPAVNTDVAEAIDQRPPFVIRGHHLEVLIALMRFTPSPAWGDLAKRDRLDAESELQIFIANNFPLPEGISREQIEDNRKKQIDYIHDIWGKSAEDADRHETRSRQTYEKFLSLPDDYPAEIVEGMPDDMCAECIMGKHCTELMQAKDNRSAIVDDGVYLEKFIDTLDNLKLPKLISQREAHFTDADPQQVRVIGTTIGAVRRVLKEGTFE